MPPSHWAGDLTVPGRMHFPGSTFRLDEPVEMSAIELTAALVAE